MPFYYDTEILSFWIISHYNISKMKMHKIMLWIKRISFETILWRKLWWFLLCTLWLRNDILHLYYLCISYEGFIPIINNNCYLRRFFVIIICMEIWKENFLLKYTVTIIITTYPEVICLTYVVQNIIILQWYKIIKSDRSTVCDIPIDIHRYSSFIK